MESTIGRSILWAGFCSLVIVHHINAQGCNSMTPVVVNPGPFQSIGWPGKYVANRDCLYNLTAPSGKTLKVTFLTFDLGPKKHGNCDAVDFLEVFEPRSDEQSSTIKLCGQTVPLSVYSKTFWMKMRFLSNSAEEFTGFNATITSLTEDEICPQKAVLNETKGTIQSPLFPNNYPAEIMRCAWEITAPEGKHVKLTFKHFDVFRCGYNCNCDSVELKLGYDSLGDEPGEGKLCQQGLNPENKRMDLSTPLYSVKNAMSINFVNSAQGSQNNKGFEAEYEFIDYTPPVCNKYIPFNFTGASGSVSSPNYPNGNYPKSMQCLSLIKVAAGFRVKLNFTFMDIEAGNPCKSLIQNQTCTCDFVRVYSGNSTYAALVGKFCGNTLPTPLISISNQMLVEFQSDFSSGAKGFHAMYSTTSEQPSSTISPPVTQAPTNGSCPNSCGNVAVMLAGLLVLVLFSNH
ncbi:tolloid-like protein 1 [Nematostella vectensis]|uniref:tolloid-like protein 1 n=1 Tax=Nematostella vectensis TaxID=45351 RepID=UPI0013904A30|nr:tolloid-like protein 1 [Nematostella vectensis]